VTDYGHNTFIGGKFRGYRASLLGRAEVITPDKLNFLTFDTAGVVDFF
jgi:hypothetical protein